MTLPTPLEADPQAPTLTVNNRLARWLSLAHDEAQLRKGRAAWRTAEIVPLDTWLKSAWENAWPDKYFLTPLQSKTLWLEIIAGDEETRKNRLLDIAGAAGRAADAYALIKQYRLNIATPAYDWTEETRAFRRWLRRYEKRLDALGALDPAEAIDQVVDGMREGRIPVPAKLVFAGFEEIPPQFAAWIEFMKNRGTGIAFDPPIPAPEARPAAVSVRRMNKKRDEAVQCARWVRSKYRPGQTVGIVVWQLEEYRALLEHELTAELAPGKIYPWVEAGKPFNFSLGTPLGQEPMVRQALAYLGASGPLLPLATFLDILTSRHFSSGREWAKEARELERVLRKRRIARVEPGQTQETAGTVPELARFFEAWRALLGNGERMRPRQWADEFNSALLKAGWPTDAEPLAGRARQAQAAWGRRLETFASLDRVLGRVSRTQAAAVLERIAETPDFQIKTPEQPIQVVGLLESAGMRFDHLWVMGCHAEALPGAPSPNPFIPVAERKRHGLPRASAGRELEFAERSLKRLLAAAPDVVLSYPEWEGNTRLRMSPLLAPWAGPGKDEGHAIKESHRHKDRLGQAALEGFEEAAALFPDAEENARFANPLPGGYSVFQHFAECPFRAFAVHRLGVGLVELPELDYDHPERGSLVHRALEYFWREVGSRKNLQRLADGGGVEKQIERAVTSALDGMSRGHWQERFFAIERERVTELLSAWMHEVELKRRDFTVTGKEESVQLDIGGLKLEMRVDRIDREDNGEVMVIDYKTGDAKPGGWFGERIVEPQLPLYAVRLMPDAVVFAQVKKGAMKLMAAGNSQPQPGVINYQNIEKKSGAASWQALLDHWRQHFESVASRFLAGENPVAPIQDGVCSRCGMQSLCRIEAVVAEANEEDGS